MLVAIWANVREHAADPHDYWGSRVVGSIPPSRQREGFRRSLACGEPSFHSSARMSALARRCWTPRLGQVRMTQVDLQKLGLSRTWAGYIRDWDRSLRSGQLPGNHPLQVAARRRAARKASLRERRGTSSPPANHNRPARRSRRTSHPHDAWNRVMFHPGLRIQIMGWVTLRARQLSRFEPKGDPYLGRVGPNSPVPNYTSGRTRSCVCGGTPTRNLWTLRARRLGHAAIGTSPPSGLAMVPTGLAGLDAKSRPLRGSAGAGLAVTTGQREGPQRTSGSCHRCTSTPRPWSR